MVTGQVRQGELFHQRREESPAADAGRNRIRPLALREDAQTLRSDRTEFANRQGKIAMRCSAQKQRRVEERTDSTFQRSASPGAASYQVIQ